MRILGVLAVMFLLAACSASGDGTGGGTSDPGAQERLDRDALQAASPGITAALAPTSHSFGGLHLDCRLGRNDYVYAINGGVVAPADTWKSGQQALSDELAAADWTLGTTANDHGVRAERGGVTLSVVRQLRTEDGVEWAVQITTPCVTYAEEDADKLRGESSVDDLSGDF